MTDLQLYHFGDPAHPSMVLLHGVTDDAASWFDGIRRWEGTWHVVAVDARGHGDSPRFTDDELRHAPQVQVDDLIQVLSELRGPAVVVGHSLGGLAGLRAGVARPDLVRALVLEDPAKPTNRFQPDPKFSADMLAFVESVVADPEGQLLELRGQTAASDEELLAWAEAKAKVDRRYLREGLFLGDGAWEELFSQLRVPTLVVGPVDGEMMPDASAITSDHVRVVTVPGAGHTVRRDQPEAFHGLVDDFLAGVPERV